MISQFQVICKILGTKDFSLVTLNNLNENHFFNYKSEFNYIKTHYETYRAVPDVLTFVGVFSEFEYTEVTEPNSYLLEQLIKDYNQAYLVTKFNDIKKYLENDKVEEAIDYFTKSVDNLQTTTALSCTDLLKDTSRYERFLDRSVNKDKYYISTGFKELDDLIGGIDRENEDMVISARPGIGKSWLLIKMATAAVNQGLTVGLYSGEMSVDKVGYRFDTLMGHIRNASITRGDLSIQSEYKRYINSLGTIKQGSFKVITPNDINGPATVSALRAFIEKEKLDILFVDQYSLLEDTNHAKTMPEKVANISKSIKNLQVMKQIPIIAVSQLNRTKNEDGEQDTTQISGSDRIGQDATCVIMLDRKAPSEGSSNLDNSEQLTLNIVKARDGGDNKKLVYAVDLNAGNFVYIPSDKDSISSAEDMDDLEDEFTRALSESESNF